MEGYFVMIEDVFLTGTLVWGLFLEISLGHALKGIP